MAVTKTHKKPIIIQIMRLLMTMPKQSIGMIIMKQKRCLNPNKRKKTNKNALNTGRFLLY